MTTRVELSQVFVMCILCSKRHLCGHAVSHKDVCKYLHSMSSNALDSVLSEALLLFEPLCYDHLELIYFVNFNAQEDVKSEVFVSRLVSECHKKLVIHWFYIAYPCSQNQYLVVKCCKHKNVQKSHTAKGVALCNHLGEWRRLRWTADKLAVRWPRMSHWHNTPSPSPAHPAWGQLWRSNK